MPRSQRPAGRGAALWLKKVTSGKGRGLATPPPCACPLPKSPLCPPVKADQWRVIECGLLSGLVLRHFRSRGPVCRSRTGPNLPSSFVLRRFTAFPIRISNRSLWPFRSSSSHTPWHRRQQFDMPSWPLPAPDPCNPASSASPRVAGPSPASAIATSILCAPACVTASSPPHHIGADQARSIATLRQRSGGVGYLPDPPWSCARAAPCRQECCRGTRPSQARTRNPGHV